MDLRFERNIGLLGEEGQRKIRAAAVAVMGIGGLGTHVVQQLALLGVGGLRLIDDEDLDHTNRNRYVGALATDPIPGTRKVDLGERLALGIDPSIRVTKVGESFVSRNGFRELQQADYVFGCLDDDGLRLILNEFCSAYSKPYFDLASDVETRSSLQYGGRVCVNWQGAGCLVCLDVLDMAAASAALASPGERRDREAIYGVNKTFLRESGPSVVSLNGVVASLAVTEFMAAVTGLRQPQKLLTYYGTTGKVTVRIDPPAADCWYCTQLRGQREEANLERYVR